MAVRHQGYETPTRGDSLAEQVYRQLSNALLSGAFAPRERINIRRLAEEIGVSVTPVRESVLRLIADGVLQTNEKNAIFVPELAEAEIQEIFAIRRFLEGDLAEAAARHLTAEDTEFLATTQNEFLAAMAQEDYREVLRCNSLFHFRIYERADLPVHLRIVESLWLRIGPTLHHMYPILQRDRTGHQSHENIIDQVRKRDPQALRAAIVTDLDFSEGALRQYLEQVVQQPRRRPVSKVR
ncbi:GntR family transcriptional regulator [Microbaculum marinum]|uniref:GntR family transcriptional regulator n=1 Tax=Microbaculum marinum TaxID=1764581 RepID=A0AAW9RJU5_9HYPH